MPSAPVDDAGRSAASLLSQAPLAAGYAALVIVFALSGVGNSGFVTGGPLWPVPVSVALGLVASGSLLWRQRCPVVVLAVAGPLAAAEITAGGQIAAYFLLFEALFDPVRYGSRCLARVTTGLAIGASVFAAVLTVAAGAAGPVLLVLLLIVAMVVSTPLLWGWEVRHHRDARRAAESLTAAERELASARADRAVDAERRRIAHDLHDVISGHLSAVSLHTSLASSLPEDTARERSLGTARDAAHAALRDLRSMIGVLSTEEAGTLPEATLDWSSLAARLRGRDAQAHVDVDPEVSDPSRVDPSVHAALLRIAAEAVTNAVRHGAAPIRLSVRADAEGACLELVNQRADTGEPGTGLGRGAIADRAEAVGGTATSAPAPEDARSWQVRARVPARPAGAEGTP